jgi:hypothetical protein
MAASFYSWTHLYRKVFAVHQYVGLCVDIIRQFDFHVPHRDARYGAQHELSFHPSSPLLTIDAAVVIAGVGLFAFIWWWAGARKYCTFQRFGPR